MVHILICFTALLFQLHPICCGTHKNVTIYIGGNKPCTATVTFTYTKGAIDPYEMELSFDEAPTGGPFNGVAAKVLPGFGPTETLIHYNTKNVGNVSSDGRTVTFHQVQIEPKDTIVVAGEKIATVTGVFEPKSTKFIVLKSTLGKGSNVQYSKLKSVKDVLKKPGVQNISKVVYMIRLSDDYAQYYSAYFEQFQDTDFQNFPERDQEEKTLILKLSTGFLEIEESEARRLRWIKVNKNVIAAKTDPKHTVAQSVGEHILRNKNSEVRFTCVVEELKSLIATFEKTQPTEIGIWGPLTLSHRSQTNAWQTFLVTEKASITLGI